MQKALKNGGILISKVLCNRLKIERAAKLPTETGGYLMGRRRGPHIEVISATFQGTKDIATRSSFERADPGHAAQAVNAWRNDRRLSGVVGDWHSHPIGAGVASPTDEQEWRTLARAEKEPIVGLIFGDAAMTVYFVKPRQVGISITRCALIEETHGDFVFSFGAGLAPEKR